MSIAFLNASAQYLYTNTDTGSGPVGITNQPLTMMCWYYYPTSDGEATQRNLVRYENTASDLFQLIIYPNSNIVRGNHTQSSLTRNADCTSCDIRDNWECVIYRVDDSASPRHALDHTTCTQGTNANSATYATNSSPELYVSWTGTAWAYTGKIAHIAFWNTRLSNTSVANLLTGSNPLDTTDVSESESNLTAYWPLTTNDANLYIDTQNGVVLTPYNSPTFDSSNPTVDAPPSGADVTYRYVLSIS